MSKTSKTVKRSPKAETGRAERRSRSERHVKTASGRSVASRRSKDESSTSRSHHGGKTVSGAARIVVRLHRDALKKLEKY